MSEYLGQYVVCIFCKVQEHDCMEYIESDQTAESKSVAESYIAPNKRGILIYRIQPSQAIP